MTPRDHKHELGVPRWRDADAYPSPTTDHQWRWEFLRRRPDYRRAWVDHFDEVQARFDLIHAECGLGPDVPRDFYRSVGTSLREVCKPFGVRNIAAPWLAEQLPLNWSPTFGSSIERPTEHARIQSLVERGKEREAEGIMHLAFDLTRPFDEQIDRVRKHFESHQADRLGAVIKPARQHKRNWAQYLRAIDARDQGATYEDLFIELRLKSLEPAEFDAQLDRNLAASGLQIWEQAQELMFKRTA